MSRYPEYKDSEYEWLGEVPEHWDVIAFKHCASIESSLVDPQLPEHIGRTLIAPNHVESGTGRILAEETAGDQGADSGKYLYHQGAVVYSKIRPALAKACIPREGGLCSADMYPLTPRSDVDSRFLLYVLISDFFTDQAVLASERVAMPKVNRETLNDFRIARPPLAEQRQLAAYLDRKTAEVDTLIQKKQALIARLGELRAALIHRAVTKGLDPDVPMKASGVEWLGEVPEHWTIPQLKYTTQFVNGAAFKPAEWVSDGIPIIRISNLNGDPVFNHSAEEVAEKYHVREGDLLFAWSGNRGTSFGPFLWAREGLYYLNQHIFRLKGYEYDTRYFYWMLKTVTTHVEEQAHGIIGMVHITKGDLGAIRVPEMPKAEQLEIARYLDETTGQIDSIVEREGKLIELLRELRTSLISEVVTGKVDVRAEPLAPEAAPLPTVIA